MLIASSKEYLYLATDCQFKISTAKCVAYNHNGNRSIIINGNIIDEICPRSGLDKKLEAYNTL